MSYNFNSKYFLVEFVHTTVSNIEAVYVLLCAAVAHNHRRCVGPSHIATDIDNCERCVGSLHIIVNVVWSRRT